MRERRKHFLRCCCKCKTQGSGRLPCYLCGNRAIQDDCDFHIIPDIIFAHLFWAYMGSHRGASLPSHDHALGSCKTVHFA